ncbi:MAG: C40 family peptidase [Bacteroidia bacterium]|nr:C40 family peptidase [Bacteroidia bacterium]
MEGEWVWIPRQSIVPLRAEPSHRSEMVSQLLWGEPQQILTEERGWLFVRGWIDGYIGWIPAGALMSAWRDEEELAIVCKPWAPLLHKGKRTGRVPIGTLTPPSGWITAIGTFRIPMQALKKWPNPAETLNMQLIWNTFKGTPYLWGGKTPAGVDCSGLTQISYRLAGRLLPRDAYQQAEATLLIHKPQKGDLVFFTPSQDSSRISHVGIAVDEVHILHATPEGGVHIARARSLFAHTFHSYRTQMEKNFVI